MPPGCVPNGVWAGDPARLRREQCAVRARRLRSGLPARRRTDAWAGQRPRGARGEVSSSREVLLAAPSLCNGSAQSQGRNGFAARSTALARRATRRSSPQRNLRGPPSARAVFAEQCGRTRPAALIYQLLTRSAGRPSGALARSRAEVRARSGLASSRQELRPGNGCRGPDGLGIETAPVTRSVPVSAPGLTVRGPGGGSTRGAPCLRYVMPVANAAHGPVQMRDCRTRIVPFSSGDLTARTSGLVLESLSTVSSSSGSPKTSRRPTITKTTRTPINTAKVVSPTQYHMWEP